MNTNKPTLEDAQAAAYVYNGFSRERIAKMIFFATLSMTDSDKEMIQARAAHYTGNTALCSAQAFVT